MTSIIFRVKLDDSFLLLEWILLCSKVCSQIKAIYEKRHLLKEYAVFIMPSF